MKLILPVPVMWSYFSVRNFLVRTLFWPHAVIEFPVKEEILIVHMETLNGC